LVTQKQRIFWEGEVFQVFDILVEKQRKERLVPCMKKDGMDPNSFSMERIQIV
jgi:hypothetical protein